MSHDQPTPLLVGIVVGIQLHGDATIEKQEGDLSFLRQPVKEAYITLDGLEKSSDWHNRNPTKMKEPRERAVLCQSEEHVEIMRKEFAHLNHSFHRSFGENITVKGLTSDKLCIGDQFRLYDTTGAPAALMEICSPRLPCYRVDQAHGSEYGLQGLRHYSMVNALAGWFFRPMGEGSLREGYEMRLEARPHPEWFLTRLSTLLYKCAQEPKSKWACWTGSSAELKEALALDELANLNWKDNLEKEKDRHDVILKSSIERNLKRAAAFALVLVALICWLQ